MIRWKTWLLIAIAVIADAAVYIYCGLMMMEYEDLYDESKGPLNSWDSHTQQQKVAIIIWAIWLVVNIAAVAYCMYRFFKKLVARRGRMKNPITD
ncbi:hypothetical protein DYU05_06985 [Mucilaginibacter terrenus]|uniref:Uncharacterized protein n=1 Tax=Mucilaginibacter terrenus TaxID=2482727 RepID=A0A3E2NWE7_9SPHI|nr:hypothetical protein [Mucilaginibacter terrenus]RFZ85335.1 hypothetical protein DYU05_06985 [Mucilaginibacter terrenus]